MNRRLNLKRYRQIVSVFSKHGFGLILDQIGILKHIRVRRYTKIEKEDVKYTTGVRLRMALEELGTTFIKLGQILSTRSDIFSKDISDELKKLQDSVIPFDYEDVKKTIESELGDKIENIFEEFNEIPIASASVSQVHRGVLKSGKVVAIKVQRPNITDTINSDLDILRDIAHFIDMHTRFGKMYDFSNTVNEFEVVLKNELDFTKEAENVDRFKKNFEKSKIFCVPEIKWVYTSKLLITMEYIEGFRIDDIEMLDYYGIDKNQIAVNLANSILNQILKDGFFHADPHPGNILINKEGKIVFLDVGMVGILSEQKRNRISSFFIGIAKNDSRKIVRSIIDLGAIQNKIVIKNFERDIDVFLDKYLTLPLREIKIAEIFYEIFSISYKNHIKIPREFALISKSLGTLQGIIEILSPELNMIEIAKPIAKKLIMDSITPQNITNEIRNTVLDYHDLIKEFPTSILDLVEKMEDDNFGIKFEIKDIDHIQKRFDRVIDRISFSVVLLSVSMIIAGIIIGSSLNANAASGTYFLNITALKIGIGIACLIIIWLIISMFRSNRD